MRLARVGLITILLVSSYVAAAGKPDPAVRRVSYCDLVKTPQSFSGDRIRVRAVYDYGFETHSLNEPTCCPVSGDRIWVEINQDLEPRSLKIYRKFPKGTGAVIATFEGRFDTGQFLSDGSYRSKLTVDKIEKLEATAKRLNSRRPASWPKTCDLIRVQ